MTASAKPRRRWLQFSLKALFGLVVVAAAACGWLKWKLDRKAALRAAVAEIRRAGGEVWYDWELAHVRNPPGAGWLRKLLGDDFFSSVVKVALTHCHHVDDEWLVHLEPFTDLSAIILDDPQVTDAGLRYLMRFKKLKLLSLGTTAVTDGGLQHLKGLTELKELYLDYTAVTDAGVADLQKAIPNCQIRR
ncbi:MAG TPA: hypothetical protein VGX76_00610 [Pirellulales bacterium]|nr:hypothetical protein [Pirellulales bacterium]